MNMKWTSLLRGLVAASFPALTLLSLGTMSDLRHWLPAMIVAYILLPVVAAFSGRRPDALSLDIALATVGGCMLVEMTIMPRGTWAGSTYVAVAVAYSVYAVVAAGLFASLATLRTALRVQGWKRLRAQ